MENIGMEQAGVPTIIDIEDPIFKEYLVKNFDKDGDGEISEAEALEVENVDCMLWQNERGNIRSLKGIEHFTNLTRLQCANNHLSQLDLSENKELVDLWCHDNDLTTLDLSKNKKLKYLRCWSNRFESLDVSKNRDLDPCPCSDDFS